MEVKDVYCPICKARVNRKKLLFRKEAGATGIIHIQCRGCKEEIEIDLSKEPVSR